MNDAFEQLRRDADKPTQVPEQLAKYVAALVNGTHEITSVTIRPKREWVGLTDEEIRMLIPPDNGWKYEIGYGEAIEFARAIEAKLREKNT